ncbi:MAG: Recombinase [Chthonomonadales bacterium]|nr:Recombinase [Chthonomonadales bacterium]
MSRSETVKQGHLLSVLSGIHPGNFPLGYMPAPRYIGPHILNPRTAPAIRSAFELRAKGWSLGQICEGLTSLGIRSTHGKILTRQALRAILTNPFYMGVIRLNGKFYPDVKPREKLALPNFW